MYGANIKVEHLIGDDRPCTSYTVNKYIVDMVSAICAYAEYYQCLDVLQPAICRVLHSSPDYWKAVPEQPARHCILAKALRDEVIYFDSLRHMGAQAHHWEGMVDHNKATWAHVAAGLECSEDKAQEFFSDEMNKIKREFIPKLTTKLLRLQLSTFKTNCRWRYTFSTNFFKAMDLEPSRNTPLSEGAKANQCSEYLARTLFGQWFVGQAHGDIPHESHSGNLYPSSEA